MRKIGCARRRRPPERRTLASRIAVTAGLSDRIAVSSISDAVRRVVIGVPVAFRRCWDVRFRLQAGRSPCTLSPLHRCRICTRSFRLAVVSTRCRPAGSPTIDGTRGRAGTELTLGQVLLVESDGGEILAGAPFVADARVLAVVEGETRGPKIRVFKKKRRKGMRRTKGHRAIFTRVRIKDILLGKSERVEPRPSQARPSPSPQPRVPSPRLRNRHGT